MAEASRKTAPPAKAESGGSSATPAGTSGTGQTGTGGQGQVTEEEQIQRDSQAGEDKGDLAEDEERRAREEKRQRQDRRGAIIQQEKAKGKAR